MIVYKITNLINKKIYIGQTTRTLSARWIDHCASAFCPCRQDITNMLHNAMRKYGKENFLCEVVATANSLDELNALEIDIIKQYSTLDKKLGYNLQAGGKNSKHTDETREKISKGHKGKKLSNHTKQKLREINTGKRLSAETIERMSHNMKIIARSPFFIKRMQETQLERWTNIDERKRYSDNCKTKKRIVDQNGIIYDSITMAAKINDLKVGAISDNVNGRQKSVKGFIFKFYIDVPSEEE